MIIKPSQRPQPLPTQTVPGEIIVKLSDAPQPLDQFESSIGGKVVEEFDFPPTIANHGGAMLRLKLADAESVEQVLEKLQTDQRVQFAEPNLVYTLDEAANPPNDLHEKDLLIGILN